MLRILASGCLSLITLNLVFANQIQTQTSDPASNNYQYEYFEPPVIEERILPNPEEDIEKYSQYKGDHDKDWYRKRNRKRSRYITFALNYTIAPDEDVTSNQVEYPGASDREANLGYSGTIDMKGGLGMDIAVGYIYSELLRFELEAHYSRTYINGFKTKSINSVTRDSGNFTDIGPEVVEDANDVLASIGGSANIILNLSKGDFIPYIGAGYGFSYLGVTTDYDAHTVMNFKLGFSYNLNDKMRVYLQGKQMIYNDVEYSYRVVKANPNNTNYDERIYNLKHDLNQTVISLGYQFNF